MSKRKGRADIYESWKKKKLTNELYKYTVWIFIWKVVWIRSNRGNEFNKITIDTYLWDGKDTDYS